jgi:hypothetical protein
VIPAMKKEKKTLEDQILEYERELQEIGNNNGETARKRLLLRDRSNLGANKNISRMSQGPNEND